MHCTKDQVATHKKWSLAVVFSLLAGAATAQTPAPSGFEMTDEEEATTPDAAYPAPHPSQPYGYVPYASPGPRPYTPRPPAFTLPDGPLPRLEQKPAAGLALGYGATGYDEEIRRAARLQDSLQGPLQGGWVLRTASGSALYAVQLVQPADRPFTPEGAWRQLGVTPGRGASGYLNLVVFNGTDLTLRFVEGTSAELRVVTLRRDLAGQWAGELWRPSGTQPVVLTR